MNSKLHHKSSGLKSIGHYKNSWQWSAIYWQLAGFGQQNITANLPTESNCAFLLGSLVPCNNWILSISSLLLHTYHPLINLGKPTSSFISTVEMLTWCYGRIKLFKDKLTKNTPWRTSQTEVMLPVRNYCSQHFITAGCCLLPSCHPTRGLPSLLHSTILPCVIVQIELLIIHVVIWFEFHITCTHIHHLSILIHCSWLVQCLIFPNCTLLPQYGQGSCTLCQLVKINIASNIAAFSQYQRVIVSLD